MRETSQSENTCFTTNKGSTLIRQYSGQEASMTSILILTINNASVHKFPKGKTYQDIYNFKQANTLTIGEVNPGF